MIVDFLVLALLFRLYVDLLYNTVININRGWVDGTWIFSRVGDWTRRNYCGGHRFILPQFQKRGQIKFKRKRTKNIILRSTKTLLGTNKLTDDDTTFKTFKAYVAINQLLTTDAKQETLLEMGASIIQILNNGTQLNTDQIQQIDQLVKDVENFHI